ncbi:LCP family protein [Alkalihalobacillus oceani]|uniref:LCP family protein n=1 Tax=Halalkalibacter oceani TaxID=1653776 RepID=UPI00203E114A|nr:LCP family protein [Halalkalibacter oceani]
MDTRMKRRQATRKKPKRKRKLLMMFVLIFSCLFLVTTAYAVMQFQAGKNEAQDNLTENEMIGSDELDEEVVEVKEPENDEPINVLLIGIDTSDQEPARTDTIMIGQYDAKNGDAKLASIMRDTYVEIPGHMNNKINYAFAAGGADLLRKTIEQNFDLDIHYYAMVNFNGFVNVVDTVAPDGLEVNIENRMYYRDTAADMVIDFQPGVQTLHGDEILKYVRFRKDSENDFGRVARQQEILALLKDELLSFSGLTRIPRLIGSVEPYLETNIGLPQMLSIGRDFALNPINDFETLRIPLDNSYRDEYYSHAGAVLEIDKEKNVQAITDFFSGKKVLANDTEAEDNEQES